MEFEQMFPPTLMEFLVQLIIEKLLDYSEVARTFFGYFFYFSLKKQIINFQGFINAYDLNYFMYLRN